MNRRNFISTVVKAGIGFSILPAATTYIRNWNGVLIPQGQERMISILDFSRPNETGISKLVRLPYSKALAYVRQNVGFIHTPIIPKNVHTVVLDGANVRLFESIRFV